MNTIFDKTRLPVLLLVGFSGILVGLFTIAPPGMAQAPQPPAEANTPIYFRTKSYRVRLVWRRGYPYLSVSHNGWQVLVDAPAKALPQRGTGDNWTSYAAQSGDYTATVRIGPTGQGAIEVMLRGGSVTQESAIFSTAPPSPSPTNQPANEARVFGLQTPEYAVRVYRKGGKLWMNLHDRKADKTILQQVPVTRRETTDSTIYQYDGASSVQARESVQGERSLLIIRDNAIQYRGVGY